MIRAVSLRCSLILAKLVADVLDAAENRTLILSRSLVLRAQIVGEALRFAGTPIGRVPHEAFAVDAPTPRCPDRTGVAEVALLQCRFGLPFVVAGVEQDRVLGIMFSVTSSKPLRFAEPWQIRGRRGTAKPLLVQCRDNV